MADPFLTLDDPPAPPRPVTSLQRHREGAVRHRGRTVRYVCVASSPGDRAALVELLADFLKRPPS